MVLPIYLYGDPILRKKGICIKEQTKELDELIDSMYITLEHSEGVGLASHQIGKPYKLFIVQYQLSNTGGEQLNEVFINPEIIEYSNETEYLLEGCLSIPNIQEEVKRPSKIKIKYLDRNFIKKEKEFDGYLSRVIQHEYDHVNGVFFIDRLPSIKKKLLNNKLHIIQKRKVSIHYKYK